VPKCGAFHGGSVRARRPHLAFGNSISDRQMLEYTEAGDGASSRLSSCTTTPRANMPTYGARPAHALYNEAKKEGWFVVSMKNDLEAHLRVRITNWSLIPHRGASLPLRRNGSFTSTPDVR